MVNNIIKDFKKGIVELGAESVEKLVEESVKIVEPIITAKELLGNISPMSEEEMSKKKNKDEHEKEEELKKIRSQFAGRSIENEMQELRNKKEREERERESLIEKNKKIEADQKAYVLDADYNSSSANHGKRKNPFRKKSEPDASQMSQTTEFKGKIN
jgi:predicted ribosome quality control (RQC) complex YloA/Tae2 family protein